ncbi:imm11 family protein [Myxococcus sp. Y35]|uniref:imm11 family protein n=1 Tax=Pseudomyxococcus flavus TaxID=3115648 RepID=UPI003CE9B46A
MSKYYQLSEDYFLDHGITAGPTLPDESIMAGKRVEADVLPELIFEISTPDDEPCQHFMSGGAVIVSQRFIEVLREAGVTNFQVFPALLINPETQKQRTGFFLFNVLGITTAADMQRSSFDVLMEAGTGGPDVPLVSFKQIVLDATKARGLHMFRLAESPSVLVIDETIKTALKENRPEEGWGIVLEEIEHAPT